MLVQNFLESLAGTPLQILQARYQKSSHIAHDLRHLVQRLGSGRRTLECRQFVQFGDGEMPRIDGGRLFHGVAHERELGALKLTAHFCDRGIVDLLACACCSTTGQNAAVTLPVSCFIMSGESTASRSEAAASASGEGGSSARACPPATRRSDATARMRKVRMTVPFRI